MAMALSLFGWDDNNADGYHESEIGFVNEIGEIDLSDDEARELIKQIQMRLNDGEHVTLRLAEKEEEPTQQELFERLESIWQFTDDGFGDNAESIHVSNGYGKYALIAPRVDDSGDWNVILGIEIKAKGFENKQTYKTADELIEALKIHLAKE